MPERHFPVLWQCGREETEQLKALDCPKTVPWSSRDGRRRRYWYEFKGSARLVAHELKLASLTGGPQ